uniref:Uncharacterized protein n=1 Tax=Arundo donax TaxID=35708 RepID=A0A0A9BCU1_ARUDO
MRNESASVHHLNQMRLNQLVVTKVAFI